MSFVLGLLLALSGCGEREPAPQPVEEVDRAPVVEPASEPEPATAAATEPSEPPAARPALGQTPLTPSAADPTPAEDAGEEPAKGGDVEFQPPSNWCGTPGMWKRPTRPLEGLGWVVYVNDAGEEQRIPLSDLTPQKLRELRREGWRVGWRLRIGK